MVARANMISDSDHPKCTHTTHTQCDTGLGDLCKSIELKQNTRTPQSCVWNGTFFDQSESVSSVLVGVMITDSQLL
jgi:hypothetical protein